MFYQRVLSVSLVNVCSLSIGDLILIFIFKLDFGEQVTEPKINIYHRLFVLISNTFKLTHHNKPQKSHKKSKKKLCDG